MSSLINYVNECTLPWSLKATVLCVLSTVPSQATVIVRLYCVYAHACVMQQKLFTALFCRTGSYREGGLPNTEEVTPHDGESSSEMASGVTHSWAKPVLDTGSPAGSGDHSTLCIRTESWHPWAEARWLAKATRCTRGFRTTKEPSATVTPCGHDLQ